MRARAQWCPQNTDGATQRTRTHPSGLHDSRQRGATIARDPWGAACLWVPLPPSSFQQLGGRRGRTIEKALGEKTWREYPCWLGRWAWGRPLSWALSEAHSPVPVGRSHPRLSTSTSSPLINFTRCPTQRCKPPRLPATPHHSAPSNVLPHYHPASPAEWPSPPLPCEHFARGLAPARTDPHWITLPCPPDPPKRLCLLTHVHPTESAIWNAWLGLNERTHGCDVPFIRVFSSPKPSRSRLKYLLQSRPPLSYGQTSVEAPAER